MLSHVSLPKFYPMRNVHHLMSHEFGVRCCCLCEKCITLIMLTEY